MAQRPSLSEAPQAEREAIERLLRGESWPRRAVAIMRLERYGCDASRQRLTDAMRDADWQARHARSAAASCAG
jgi:HEAT repeat protein